MLRLLFCALLFGALNVEGAKILMMFNAISRSHYILGEALGLGLAEKGHEVTMISPFKKNNNHANFKEIILEDAFDSLLAKEMQNSLVDNKNRNTWKMVFRMAYIGADGTNKTFHNTEVQKLLKSGQKFDVFLTEWFMNEALLLMAQHFNAIPMIMSTAGSSGWTNKMVGNPFNPAYDINLILPFTNPLSFSERLISTAFMVLEEILYCRHMSHQSALYEEHFRSLNGRDRMNEPDLPSIVTNISLLLLNSNLAVSNARAYVPNVVSVGGLHVNPGKLPDDLQKILDDSPQGVIYFSMGSNLKSSNLPVETRNGILRTFAKLNHTVLWKWEDDKLPNQPKNVIIRKWMPQQSILAHPNVKLFITHGGLLSSIEALYFGIPLVGIPVFGDQPMNMARAVKSGYGIKVDLDTISEEILDEAISNALGNPKYRERAQFLSNIFRDQDQSPMDKAVSSIEYVLRHKGAPFLRSPAVHMPVYQKILLDVIAGLLAIILLPIFILYWVVKKIVKKCCRSSKVNNAKKRN